MNKIVCACISFMAFPAHASLTSLPFADSFSAKPSISMLECWNTSSQVDKYLEQQRDNIAATISDNPKLNAYAFQIPVEDFPRVLDLAGLPADAEKFRLLLRQAQAYRKSFCTEAPLQVSR